MTRSLAAVLLILIAAISSTASAQADAGQSPASRLLQEKLAAIRNVSRALAREEGISPALKASLQVLLGVLEREARALQSPEDELTQTLERLTVRSQEQERVLLPLVQLVDTLSVYGDLRLRHETDLNRDDKPTRNRQRVRFRLGANMEVTDELVIGARIVTGDPDDVRSTQQTLGDGFDVLDLSLDRAFADFHSDAVPGLWVRGGKFAHPFQTNPVYGELVWDADVQPEGIATGYSAQDVAGLDHLGLTLGEYIVLEQGDLDEASAFVAQVTGRKALGAEWDLAGSIGYYRYTDLTPDGATAVTDDNAGNALDPDGDFRSDFGIVNPILAGTYDGLEQPLTVSGEFMKNTRARDGNDRGWALGAAYGTTREQGDWRAYYQFQKIEQDAVLSPFAQDDFLLTTGFRGHVGGYQYQLRDAVQLHLWGLVAQRLASTQGTTVDDRGQQWRLRLDLNVKF